MMSWILLNILSVLLLLQGVVFLYAFVFLDGLILKAVSILFISFYIFYFVWALKFINFKNKSKYDH